MKKITFCTILFFIFVSTLLFAEEDQEENGDLPSNRRFCEFPVLPQAGHNIYDFIPKGWKLIDKAKGDLNKDGLPDIAGVIEKKYDNLEKSDEAERVLFIAFNKGNGSFKLSIQNNNAILLHGDGGIWGDPFIFHGTDDSKHGKNQETGIFINRGSLLIKFYGGSMWAWSHKYRFRYQNKGWYLIGYDYEWYHTGDIRVEDTKESYNYLTGKQIVGGFVPYEKNSKKPVENPTSVYGKDYRWVWKESIKYIGKKKLENLKDFRVNPEEKSFLY